MRLYPESMAETCDETRVKHAYCKYGWIVSIVLLSLVSFHKVVICRSSSLRGRPRQAATMSLVVFNNRRENQNGDHSLTQFVRTSCYDAPTKEKEKTPFLGKRNFSKATGAWRVQ